eukprot:65939-Pelagomonas_calceolata.AAC.6
MGRKPLGLPASGKVQTWLPWPAQRTPRPETRHAGQAKSLRQPCSIRGPPWPEPSTPSPAIKLGMRAKQKVLSGQPRFGDLRCSGQSLGAKIPTVLVLIINNSNCDGIFYLCFNNGVRCRVNREVKAQKFADAMKSMFCTPCPGVWEGPVVAPGRTGFANFSASLATLPPLVFYASAVFGIGHALFSPRYSNQKSLLEQSTKDALCLLSANKGLGHS